MSDKNRLTVALFTTPTQAATISAAIAHYLRANRESSDPDVRATCEQLRNFQRHITEQVQAPPEPAPTTVEILATLCRLNQAARRSRELPPNSEEYRVQAEIFRECYSKLVIIWYIPLHFDQQSHSWQLGDSFAPERRNHDRRQSASDMAQFLREQGTSTS